MSTRLHPVALGGVLLIVALLLGLARVGAASADVAPPEGWGAAYERAAVEYWGEATRCEGTTVDFDSPLPLAYRLEQGGGRVLARATVNEASGGHCYMWIAPLPGRGVYFRCVLFAHEYGHWLGHPDSPGDPRRSVSAELLGEYTVDAPCHDLVEAVAAGNPK